MSEGMVGGRRWWGAWWRRVGGLAAAAGIGLLAVGCVGSASSHQAQVGSAATRSSSPSGGSSSVGTVYAQAVAYANCMRNHGVASWPDPNSSGVFAKSKITPQQLGLTMSKINTAQADCQHLQPNYASAGPTSAEVQQVRAQALRFSQCMRNHGMTDFPDPDSRGGIRIPQSIQNLPGYDAALNACKPFPPPPYPAG